MRRRYPGYSFKELAEYRLRREIHKIGYLLHTHVGRKQQSLAFGYNITIYKLTCATSGYLFNCDGEIFRCHAKYGSIKCNLTLCFVMSLQFIFETTEEPLMRVLRFAHHRIVLLNRISVKHCQHEMTGSFESERSCLRMHQIGKHLQTCIESPEIRRQIHNRTLDYRIPQQTAGSVFVEQPGRK